MLDINLMPWRQLLLHHKRRRIFVEIICGLVIGVLSALGLRLLLVYLSDYSEMHILKLQKQLNVLQQQLPVSKESLLQEKESIDLEKINHEQEQVIYGLQQVSVLLPALAKLHYVKFTNNAWHILGYAANLTIVFDYAHALEQKLHAIVLSKFITQGSRINFTFNINTHNYDAANS